MSSAGQNVLGWRLSHSCTLFEEQIRAHYDKCDVREFVAGSLMPRESEQQELHACWCRKKNSELGLCAAPGGLTSISEVTFLNGTAQNLLTMMNCFPWHRENGGFGAKMGQDTTVGAVYAEIHRLSAEVKQIKKDRSRKADQERQIKKGRSRKADQGRQIKGRQIKEGRSRKPRICIKIKDLPRSTARC